MNKLKIFLILLVSFLGIFSSIGAQSLMLFDYGKITSDGSGNITSISFKGNGASLTNLNPTNLLYNTVVTQSTAVLDFNLPETILTNNITYTSYQGAPSTGVRSVMANIIGTNVTVSWPTTWTPNNPNTVYLTNGYVGFRVVAVASLATNVMAITYQP